MVLIQKDPSNITYQFTILDENKKEVLTGDGFNTSEEIIDFLKEIKENI